MIEMKVFIITVFMFCQTSAFSRTNFVVQDAEVCPSENVIKLVGNVTFENKKQFLHADAVLPLALDENIGVIVNIDYKPDGKTFVPLFQIRETNLCKAQHKYLRQFIYDLERHMQLTPGVCPIRSGHYHINHYELRFQDIALQTFPFGQLKFTFNVVNNKDIDKSLVCVIFVVKNIEN